MDIAKKRTQLSRIRRNSPARLKRTKVLEWNVRCIPGATARKRSGQARTENIMASMGTRNCEYLEAIHHLPAGAVLVFHDVRWDRYENLMEEIVHRPGLRISYDEGRLEVVSPLPEHEKHKEFLSHLARLLSDEFGTELESFGSTTWRRRKLRKGIEADACFYVANAHQIIGKRTIDLESDPPPDIVIEIDVKSPSLPKLPIYAALQVPEIWLYDGKRLLIYALAGDTYEETASSRFFPGLTSLLIGESLELSKIRGHTHALKVLRQQLRKTRGR
jgi:Uma2 family endonuclease